MLQQRSFNLNVQRSTSNNCTHVHDCVHIPRVSRVGLTVRILSTGWNLWIFPGVNATSMGLNLGEYKRMGAQYVSVILNSYSQWLLSLRQPKSSSLAQMVILPFGSSRNTWNFVRGTVRSLFKSTLLTENSSNCGDRFKLAVVKDTIRMGPLTMRSSVTT